MDLAKVCAHLESEGMRIEQGESGSFMVRKDCWRMVDVRLGSDGYIDAVILEPYELPQIVVTALNRLGVIWMQGYDGDFSMRKALGSSFESSRVLV